MHTIGTTFGGLHIYKVRVRCDGLKVTSTYELLPASCYDYGHIGHGIKDCSKMCEEKRAKLETTITIALKAESNLKEDNVEFDFADKSNFGLGNDFLCSTEVSESDSSNEGLEWNLIRPKGFISNGKENVTLGKRKLGYSTTWLDEFEDETEVLKSQKRDISIEESTSTESQYH
ncbi:hypothetical protein Golob_000939 [Gossypium lobatum]|uniref:Uncharacterized protein n=1 Tax=Gossypium lobatum TaxID=34289 RepID=A0A7J8N9I5_9ROSI|nr:hypothetical protein [Gossypium lobatum]